MVKKILVVTGIFLAFFIMAFIGFISYTKSFSPQEEVSLNKEDLEINIRYSRPYKRERKIFGGLVPYNEVWRTGANEATIFSTSSTLIIKEKALPAGKYTLWTIPGEEKWQIIWNKETGQWGVDLDQKANRDPAYDELIVEAPVIRSSKTFEQFTIDIKSVADDINMILMWEQTMIVIPMTTVKDPEEE